MPPHLFSSFWCPELPSLSPFLSFFCNATKVNFLKHKLSLHIPTWNLMMFFSQTEIEADIVLCSWVSAPLTNFTSFLPCSNHTSNLKVLPNDFYTQSWFFCSQPVSISIPLCRWLFPQYLMRSCLPSKTKYRSPSMAGPKALPHLFFIPKCLGHASFSFIAVWIFTLLQCELLGCLDSYSICLYIASSNIMPDIYRYTNVY